MSGRCVGLLLILSINIVLGQSMAAQRDGPTIPPVEPVGEISISPDAVFVAQCLELFQKLNANGDWVLGSSMTTIHEPWGVVWRADFDVPEEPFAHLVNRVICWRTPGTGDLNIRLAMGQRTTRLSFS